MTSSRSISSIGIAFETIRIIRLEIQNQSLSFSPPTKETSKIKRKTKEKDISSNDPIEIDLSDSN